MEQRIPNVPMKRIDRVIEDSSQNSATDWRIIVLERSGDEAELR